MFHLQLIRMQNYSYVPCDLMHLPWTKARTLSRFVVNLFGLMENEAQKHAKAKTKRVNDDDNQYTKQAKVYQNRDADEVLLPRNQDNAHPQSLNINLKLGDSQVSLYELMFSLCSKITVIH